MNSLTRLLSIARKEIGELCRDRLNNGIILGISIMHIILFAYAINTDARHLRTGVADQAQTQLSHSLIQDAQVSQIIEIVVTKYTAEVLTMFTIIVLDLAILRSRKPLDLYA